MLVAGAIYIATRSKTATIPDYGPTDAELGIPPAPKPKPADRSALLLEALKEEIFQLEVEHKQGRISQQEYEKAKAALDQTLERAVKRTAVRSQPRASSERFQRSIRGRCQPSDWRRAGFPPAGAHAGARAGLTRRERVVSGPAYLPESPRPQVNPPAWRTI